MSEGPAIPRQARAEAAVWLARLRADDRSSADEQGFRAWLEANPDNQAAFEAVDRTWSMVGGIGATVSAPEKPRMLQRRHVLLSAAGLVVAGAVGLTSFRGASAHVYETDIGEQKRVTLGDGSQLFLDAKTRVSVSFNDTVRDVDMQYGRANFRVAPDNGRPFVVQAADRKIVSQQCSFDVRCDGNDMQVVLIHGEADVHAAADGGAATRMKSGERMIASANTETFDRPRLAPLLAWQTGYEIFEGKRLEDAVEEMNRYSERKVQVDASVADLKVSGVYRIGDNIAFAHSVAKLLSASVRESRDTITIVAQENN